MEVQSDILSNRLAQINPHLDEWCLEYTPLNHAQCISLLERATILSRAQVVDHILNVLNGIDSELFVWDKSHKQFIVSRQFATAHLNSTCFRQFAQSFADIGTKFRIMFDFTDIEYIRGHTFKAFQIALRHILEEIIGQTNKIRVYFFRNKIKTVNEFTISLIALAPYIDNLENGCIILTIQNLFAIYLDVIAEVPFGSPRIYCNQILTAIYKRLFIPQKRIRSIVFTLFDHCLRPMFISLEYLFTQITSITELSESSEFLFASTFKSDEELYFAAYSHEEFQQFWNDFMHFDSKLCHDLPLFSSETLKFVTEAIKSGFILRKNGLPPHATFSKTSNRILSEFHTNLNVQLRRNARPDDMFDIDTEAEEEIYQFEVMDSIKHLLKLAPLRKHQFKSFNLPNPTVYDMHSILNDSLIATFDSLSRPIIDTFFQEFRFRHLKLFQFYCDFFLIQQPEHVLHYIYYLFPLIQDMFGGENFEAAEKLVNQIHRNGSESLQFFKLNVHSKLSFCSNHFTSLTLFDNLFFSPSFANDLVMSHDTSHANRTENRFYNFWPLTQLFNPKVTDIFNQLFQFLLKLRFMQYQLGSEFFLSPKFRCNQLSKNSYLFRFRLLTQMVLIDRQMDNRIQELVQTTYRRFEEAPNFEQYLKHHQRFIDKLTQINQVISKNFIKNLLNTAAKFGEQTNTLSTSFSVSPSKLNRRQSLYDTLMHLDSVNQGDFFNSFQL